MRQVLAESAAPFDRMYAVRGLAALGETEGAVDIVAAVYRRAKRNTDFEGVRHLAITVLAELGLPETIPVLRECLEDESGTVRVRAAKALADLGNLDGLATLRDLLEAARRIDAQQAAEALVEIGGEAASPSRATS